MKWSPFDSAPIWACLAFILFGALAIAPRMAHAKALVADLSAYRIPIASDFRGTRIFLFGSRGVSGQVVVVVRGPNQNYMVRKKEQVLGMWLVRQQVEFENVPQFYTLASTAPLDFISSPELRSQLQLGVEALPLKPIHALHIPDVQLSEFQNALRTHQTDQLLYSETASPVRFIGDTLFKADILFPDNIRPGDYVADVYLLDGSGLNATQSIPIRVRKRGLEATLSRGAHETPLLYGLGAVTLAMLFGWAAHRIFQRIG
jgi:uncharacterized protein (TIGR02186 family)